MRLRTAAWAVTSTALFLFAWLFRFNDPSGSYAGLTDDHLFYLVRGWQILFGELPVRDFVDHGAPLYYYVGAAVQAFVGRGTLSEVAFSATVLAVCAVGVFWLAARASGSIVLGLLAGLASVLIAPRFYNYPKILVYVLAIPAIWWFASRPGWKPRLAVAVVTVAGFLFRHDHGVFVALAFAAMLVLLAGMSLRDRLRHGLVYGGLVLALLAPYLVFIQASGGLLTYVEESAAWAQRDRERTPLVWPGLFDNPNGVSPEAADGSAVSRAVATVRDNRVAWLYYTELALPLVALVLVALSPAGFRAAWPGAAPKIAVVALLGILLNAGFLRSPLEARLADPSVPHLVLLAWMVVALGAVWRSRDVLRPRLRSAAPVLRVAATILVVPLLVVAAIVLTADLPRRLDQSAVNRGVSNAFQRASSVAGQLRTEWDLDYWRSREDRAALIDLSLYLDACTRPDDRVFVQGYLPSVTALARRGFAAGHADLRPEFFDTPEAEALAIARMEAQSVPVVLLDTGPSYYNFRESYPAVTAWFDGRYEFAGTHLFDGRFGINLFVRRDHAPEGWYAPLDWPCPYVQDSSLEGS